MADRHQIGARTGADSLDDLHIVTLIRPSGGRIGRIGRIKHPWIEQLAIALADQTQVQIVDQHRRGRIE